MEVRFDIDLEAHAKSENFSSIEELIASQAVKNLVDTTSHNSREMIKSLMEQRAIAAIDKALGDISTRVFTKTNSFGEATGKPYTFLELILQSVDAWASQPVDYRGHADRSGKTSRVEFMAHSLASDIAKEHLDEAMKQLKELTSDKIGKMVKAGVEKTFGIKK